MTTDTSAAAASRAPRAGLFDALDKKAAVLAFVLGLAAILAALGSQYIGGLQPCELCLEQRLAYYFGLPVLAAVILLWNRLPLAVWFLGIALVAGIFAWGAGLGIYHAGVEYGFWPGPTACTGTGTGISFEDLSNLQPVIPCDKVQFQLFGVSLAGMNALVSLAVVGLLLLAIGDQWRRQRRR
jgi:disulfide bond formation protein DsbB